MEGTSSAINAVFEPADLGRKPSHRTRSKDVVSVADEVQGLHTAADIDHQSATRHMLANLAITSDSNPRILSDEENDRMNRKIDRLMAAIDERRPIHFAPDAETGEVEIFADHFGHDIHQDGDELEQNIAASFENFGRIVRSGDGIRRLRSPFSLQYADSNDSWASTESNKSSSNAWQRAVAAANIRFALENGRLDQEATVIRQPFRSSIIENEARTGRSHVRTISPIPLDWNKRVRATTPSIHSNGTEQDTSSPLFRKSCERIRRDSYAEPPGSSFQSEFPDNSQLEERAFVSEPRDVPSPNVRESKAPSSTGRAFGVFEDASNCTSSSKEVQKPALRSKALKDISNLRRPGYLHFNSFAKDANSADDHIGAAPPAIASSTGFGGAPDPESRRSYIKSKWPGLVQDPNNGSMPEPPRLDGVARRRNEQIIGRPIDRSHYSLSHVRTSVADSSLNHDPVRQAHFDLALARLEGRALPPPPSPILRHPDSAALFDSDIRIEGSHRPLPIRGPTPRRSAHLIPHWAFWRYSS